MCGWIPQEILKCKSGKVRQESEAILPNTVSQHPSHNQEPDDETHEESEHGFPPILGEDSSLAENYKNRAAQDRLFRISKCQNQSASGPGDCASTENENDASDIGDWVVVAYRLKQRDGCCCRKDHGQAHGPIHILSTQRKPCSQDEANGY